MVMVEAQVLAPKDDCGQGRQALIGGEVAAVKLHAEGFLRCLSHSIWGPRDGANYYRQHGLCLRTPSALYPFQVQQ